MFSEQIKWAKQAGVDFVIAETFGFLGEALLANTVIKEEFDLPSVVTIVIHQDGKTRDGYSPEEALLALEVGFPSPLQSPSVLLISYVYLVEGGSGCDRVQLLPRPGHDAADHREGGQDHQDPSGRPAGALPHHRTGAHLLLPQGRTRTDTTHTRGKKEHGSVCVAPHSQCFDLL
jgi:hypothetical protein